MKFIVIVAVCAAVAFAFACTKREDSFVQETVDLNGASPQDAYVALNCSRCHGTELQGQRTAPALTGLSSKWTEDDLVAYLRDPAAARAANPRLAHVAEQYVIDMPAYPHTEETVLRGLAGWILAR
jgi:cytochrome c553